jgi:GH18 family chitinase
MIACQADWLTDVDIDMEYPGGNGADYKQVVNSKKTYEIQAFPKLLKEIKKFIGSKELSIAVPGLERDMIAYIPSETPLIEKSVDFVNVNTPPQPYEITPLTSSGHDLRSHEPP